MLLILDKRAKKTLNVKFCIEITGAQLKINRTNS